MISTYKVVPIRTAFFFAYFAMGASMGASMGATFL